MGGYYTIHSKALREVCSFNRQFISLRERHNSLYFKLKKACLFFRQRQKNLSCAQLKFAPRKLCTSLSTQFVDKVLALCSATGAVRRATPPNAAHQPAQLQRDTVQSHSNRAPASVRVSA
jgi:hypothetical protein